MQPKVRAHRSVAIDVKTRDEVESFSVDGHKGHKINTNNYNMCL